MAELLVKAVSYTHPDPVIDAASAYKKGDIVVVREDGHVWGSGEGPLAFVLIKVPGVTQASVEDKIEPWRQIINYEIVQTNLTVDGARIRLYAETPGLANEYGFTYAKAEGWIEKWGGTLFSSDTNDVRFEILIQDIYKSEGLWGADPAGLGIVITETNYDEPTGIHSATIDLSGAPNVDTATAEQLVAELGGIVTGTAGNVVSVDFQRDTIRTAFINALTSSLRKRLVRRRYYFAEADVDFALAQGGTITVTPAQVAAKVLDKAA